MRGKRKPIVAKVYEHVCFHEKEIMDMHKILTGDGEPEKSLCRQVALIAERQGNIIDELKEAKERKKGTPQMIINWVSLIIAFAMFVIAYVSLNAGQKKIEAEAKITRKLLTPDSAETAVTIRGQVYVPFLKTDSANIIHERTLDSIYNKFMKTQK